MNTYEPSVTFDVSNKQYLVESVFLFLNRLQLGR